jgi:Tfp pilus assembly protein PilX
MKGMPTINRTGQGIFRRGYRRSAGFVALTVLMLAMLAFVGALTMMSVSQSQIRSAARSQNRMTGLVLAEAGVDDAVLQISSAPDFTGRSGSLYEDPPINSRISGTYQIQ